MQALRIIGLARQPDDRRLYVGEVVKATGITENLVRNILLRFRTTGLMDSEMESDIAMLDRGGGTPRRYYWLTEYGREVAASIVNAMGKTKATEAGIPV